jgi:uncharacterized protein DUF4082/Big-like domain-containing protein
LSYNVSTNSTTVLHTFAGYASIAFGGADGNGEGDISWDGDHLPILGDNTYGMIYTISTGALTQAHNLLAITLGVAVDVWDLTPSNRAVLRWGNVGGGVAYFDQNMNFLGQVTHWAGHSDRTKDADGADLEVASNSADQTVVDQSLVASCPNAIVKVRLAQQTQTCLQPFDWSLDAHVSCNNVGQGWCLVSTDEGTPGSVPYANELLQVKLDGSGTTRLAHSRASNATYDEQPRAAISPDGKYVVFDSDMGTGTVDVYLLALPTSQSTASNTTPPTVSVTAPSSGATISGTVTVSAAATDNVGVASVQFKLDGSNLGAQVTAAPYAASWNTTTVLNGAHVLTAVARDAAANVATSSSVSVTVMNTGSVPVSPASVPGLGSLWTAAATPAVVDWPDPNPVELGVRFLSDTAGSITALRFYKSPGSAGPHIGHLWTATGTLLATVTFANETGSGWQQASLASPVPINANTPYVASYFAPSGQYPLTYHGFAPAGVSTPPLTAPATPTNGLYTYAGDHFPNGATGTNYWVDVVFSTNAGVPPSSTCPCSLRTAAATPTVVDWPDPNPVELGVRFLANVAGSITALRFYKSPGSAGPHIGHLWTATGTLLATVTFANETASGWQQASLAAPVPINANTPYVASYFAPSGQYPLTYHGFAPAGVSAPPLTAPATPTNGLYTYAGDQFPNGATGTNYWVDVVFSTP